MPTFNSPTEMAQYLVEAFTGEEDYRYDLSVVVNGISTHLHEVEDQLPILRMVVPMMRLDQPPNPREVAYEAVCLLLTEATNNDACDVVVRERSAHFDIHKDLDYLNLGNDLSVVVVEAHVLDYLS